LERTKSSLKSTDGIIVAIGPGSFNGLRVGVSTAKGLAFSMGIPLVGINTMEAASYQYAESGLPVCPIFNAGRGEIAAALYQRKDNQWSQITNQHITTTDGLIREITDITIFCGEPTAVVLERLKDKLGRKAIIPSSISRLRRAAFLAELGIKRLETGDHDTPASLQPIYLRLPPITQPKRPVYTIQAEQSKKE
jgi:tRNA threonylcarbamoyl adenosine modification protein YeaZ